MLNHFSRTDLKWLLILTNMLFGFESLRRNLHI